MSVVEKVNSYVQEPFCNWQHAFLYKLAGLKKNKKPIRHRSLALSKEKMGRCVLLRGFNYENLGEVFVYILTKMVTSKNRVIM